ncbi:solute-binding iron ABC transport protein [Yersinia intermedia]|uniref:ABC transporter substrate-binding protein n=1 Tax=Yersinia intermedia TaxID=631 RepID=A0ABX6FB75_YERIN|nr:siderophore ABC transporter substrate-binding protein [Yersinia intermedia]AJJ17850.1 periplasmic binding family protein [Yersinia intermedia]EEQ17467.1 Iron transport protein [Yersinia intermedia ATCC 29909]MDA5482261.1 siderophore ABC transporter substrate-binding protein [Yersinia intermedia]MDA5513658.1 siderophore ABC transporter substrate-binding protein [Yersinia intermedia]QGR64930.1 ABC transporter substrate-binding protein [Yersinia intermedia]
MRLRLALFSSLLAATVAITGCDDSSATPEESAKISIEHAQGTTQVPLNPQKVIILNPSVLDTADALHIKVAGVPQTSAHLPAFLSQYSGTEYLNAGTLFEPDYEALSQAKPDLIIAGGRAHDAYDKLSAIAPTIALDVDTQHFTQSLAQRTEQLASIFGKEEEAKALLSKFSSQINEIKQKSANAGSAMVVMVSGGKMSAYTPGSRFGFVFDELGFTPAATFTQTGSHGNVVTSEFILNANPEWLFVLDRDNAIGRAEGQSAQQVLDNPLIHKTKAWQNDHVIYLDSASLYIAGGIQSYTKLMDKVSTVLDKSAPAQ